MSEIHTIKRIDNSRRVRANSPHQMREMTRAIVFAGVLAGAGLLYAYGHFQCLQLGYQMEELKAERAQAAELNAQLKLEVAGLTSPGRIDAIARRQLGLTAPAISPLGPGASPADAVLAQMRALADAPQQ